MLTHPLVGNDYHAAQDYMATKITFLLAKNAELDEWEHEIHALYPAVAHSNGRRNAFLFDFTLARFLSALTVAAPTLMPSNPGIGQNDRFVVSFCDVVSHHPLAAEAVWSEHNRDNGYPETGARLPSTMALLMHLHRAASSIDLRAAMQHLPAELTRDVFADLRPR